MFFMTSKLYISKSINVFNFAHCLFLPFKYSQQKTDTIYFLVEFKSTYLSLFSFYLFLDFVFKFFYKEGH